LYKCSPNLPSGGGNKKQGITSRVGLNNWENREIQTQSNGIGRFKLHFMNQLGGVEPGHSMFGGRWNRGDGLLKQLYEKQLLEEIKEDQYNGVTVPLEKRLVRSLYLGSGLNKLGEGLCDGKGKYKDQTRDKNEDIALYTKISKNNGKTIIVINYPRVDDISGRMNFIGGKNIFCQHFPYQDQVQVLFYDSSDILLNQYNYGNSNFFTVENQSIVNESYFTTTITLDSPIYNKEVYIKIVSEIGYGEPTCYLVRFSIDTKKLGYFKY
jgi:hypothetical protein